VDDGLWCCIAWLNHALSSPKTGCAPLAEQFVLGLVLFSQEKSSPNCAAKFCNFFIISFMGYGSGFSLVRESGRLCSLFRGYTQTLKGAGAGPSHSLRLPGKDVQTSKKKKRFSKDCICGLP